MPDTTHKCQIAKVDDEARVVFGWAYVANDDGEVVIDHSGDFIDKVAMPDLERAVHGFVLESREADEMHVKTEGVGKLVESVFMTEEKAAAMGATISKEGWWVGFKVFDDNVWKLVKDGTYQMFSFAGIGEREPLEASA